MQKKVSLLDERQDYTEFQECITKGLLNYRRGQEKY